MARDTQVWFPLFEFHEYAYESVLVLPTPIEGAAPAGSAVTARKWAKGEFACGQAMSDDVGYTLDGRLSFAPGVEMAVSAKGILGSGNAPASFEATGTGTEGPTKGAIYKLVGWAFPELPALNGGAGILTVRGSVQAIRGPDSKPEVELGGMPLGTVGTFVITRTAAIV